MADENVESAILPPDLARKALDKYDAEYRKTMAQDDSLPNTIATISGRMSELSTKPASTDGGENTNPEIIDKSQKFSAPQYRLRQSGPGEPGPIGNPLDVLSKQPQAEISKPPSTTLPTK